MDKEGLKEDHQKLLNVTAAELRHEQQRVNKYIRAHQKDKQAIVHSLSYRIGYVLTFPLRKILGIFKGKPTPLFHKIKSNEYFLESFNKRIADIRRVISDKSAPSLFKSQNSIQGFIDELNHGVVKGWYRDVNNPFNRLELQIHHNEQIVEKIICDQYRLDLAQKKIGDGHYGFELDLKDLQKRNKGEIILKFKNGPIIATYLLSDDAIELLQQHELKTTSIDDGHHLKKYDFTFEGIQKDHICGWIIDVEDPAHKVNVFLFLEDEFLNSAMANLYRSDVEFAGKGDGKFGFNIKIPYEKLIGKPAVFKAITQDGVYLGEAEWNSNLYKKQLSIHPFKPNKTMFLPIDDGISELKLEAFDFKIAVHIHVFYVDVFETICSYLKNISGHFDLLISTSQEMKQEIQQVLSKTNFNGKAVIKKVPNRGRDIAPMMIEFGKELLSYDLALHLHTKKTAHNKNLGELWMLHILKCLLSDELYLNSIFKLFKLNDQLGIVAPTLIDDLVRFYNWGDNHQMATQLFKDINIQKKWLPNEAEGIEFPAGTMFWFRPIALKKLLNSNLAYTSFPKEPIDADGTIAHAIERCMYYVAKESSFDYLMVQPLKPKAVLPNNSIKISIIVPVYNGKKWLLDAVQSIITQQSLLSTYEIILVDNNSTDGSDVLGKRYATIYPQIKYLKEEKKGAGNARNLGLKKAGGDYIFFLDADDLIGNTSLQALLDKAEYSDAELVVSPLVIFDEHHFKEASPYDYTKYQHTLAMKELKNRKANAIEEKLLYALFSDFGPCAKLYKRSFLEQHQLFFPENTNYEDNIFIYSVYLKAEKIEICGSPTYYYRKFNEEKGITQSTASDEHSLIEQCLIIKELQQLSAQKSHQHLSPFVQASLVKKLFWFFNVLDKLPHAQSPFYQHLKDILTKIPEERIDQEGRQYVSFFKEIRKGAYSKAKSIFSSNK